MGFFSNSYPDRMPFLERVGKEWRFRKAVKASKRAHGQPQFILVHPDWPSKRASIMAYADTLGWVVTNRPETPAKFNGTTALKLAFDDRTEKRQAQPGFWNGHCLDISKSTLDRHHQEVFGYGVNVDPTSHTGPMLEKSEGNAVHDGREIQGPLSPNEVQQGKVYQRIIDNRTESGLFEDLRVVVIQGQVPVVYRKRKSQDVRYTNETAEVDLAESPKNVLSDTEIAQIASLSAKMRAEFAELDVLRDREDQRIYCVDLNPTPYGPPSGLPEGERSRALDQVRALIRP
ncbi:MAG: hypothetical protein L7S67_09775 [Flavobacteriales bacterium]|nr:hypothetical protein [Flavobacteriales bacterium]